MARGANTEPQQYVLESDRAIPESEQTVFHIRCKNTIMGNSTLQRYTRAQRQNPDGTGDFDLPKLTLADKEDFLSFCSKVENYGWSAAYIRKHPQVTVNDTGFSVEPIVDPENPVSLTVTCGC